MDRLFLLQLTKAGKLGNPRLEELSILVSNGGLWSASEKLIAHLMEERQSDKQCHTSGAPRPVSAEKR